MKKIYIIAIISATICGILLYSFFSGYEKKVGETKTKAENQKKTEMVVVAGKNIKAYTEIKRDMLQLVSVPEGSAHGNAARKIEDVEGRITEREIESGEQILKNKIYEKGSSGTSLSYQLPKGMRAMTIVVDLPQNIAGYMKEGDLIDLISGGKTKKYVICSGVEVLRLGEVTNRGSGMVNTNITLKLTKKQCMTVSSLAESGFSVALWSKSDQTNQQQHR